MKIEEFSVICIDNSNTDLKLNKIYQATNSLLKDNKYIIHASKRSIYYKKSKFSKIRDYRINELI